MGSIDAGNDHTHQLLELILHRMECLEVKVERIDRRADEWYKSVDPSDPIRELEENQRKINALLPMRTDQMVFTFEQCLVDSAETAASSRTVDKVCFYTFS